MVASSISRLKSLRISWIGGCWDSNDYPGCQRGKLFGMSGNLGNQLSHSYKSSCRQHTPHQGHHPNKPKQDHRCRCGICSKFLLLLRSFFLGSSPGDPRFPMYLLCQRFPCPSTTSGCMPTSPSRREMAAGSMHATRSQAILEQSIKVSLKPNSNTASSVLGYEQE